MRFALAAFADEADHSIARQIIALRENGISYLEIRGVDGENVSNITLAKAKEVRAELDANGIAVWSLASPYGKIKISDDFAPHLDEFKRGLELAHIFGAKHLRLFSFYVPHTGADTYINEVMERLDSFRTAAKGSGIMLCHENEKRHLRRYRLPLCAYPPDISRYQSRVRSCKLCAVRAGYVCCMGSSLRLCGIHAY